METFRVVTPLLLVCWLLIIPLLAGLFPACLLPMKQRTAGMTWLLGLLVSFVVFEPVAVICMLRFVYESFTRCTVIYASLMLLLALAGVVRIALVIRANRARGVLETLLTLFPGYRSEKLTDLLYPRRMRVRINRRFSTSELLYTSIFLGLLAFQLVMAVLYAPFDGDDAYYVVETLQAQQTGTMYTLQPYLGYSTVLDYRHALAAWPLWIAFIARMCCIHATILSHTVLPLLLIPLCYYILAQCGALLLPERKDLLPLFLCFCSLFMLFGNVSIYTPETFFLMRTWQGKAMIGSFVIPALFWCFLLLVSEETKHGQGAMISGRRERLYPWLLLFLVNASAGFFSTSGILLSMMLTMAAAAATVLLSGRKPEITTRRAFLCHRAGIALAAGMTCVPAGILTILSLILRRTV